MRSVYQFIFNKSEWWWGKMAASTLIGAIIGAKAAYGDGDASVHGNWQTYAMGGGAVGLLASFFLMLNDYRRQVNVDDVAPDTQAVKPRWSRGTMITVVVGLIMLIVVLNAVWAIYGLMH